MTTLNENETKVLNLLIAETMDCTQGEFGYMEDVNRGGFSKHEFAGYISQLRQKGYFDYLSDEFGGQFALREEYTLSIRKV